MKKTVGVVLFDGFELLDVFGPLEMFGQFSDIFSLLLISERGGEIRSHQGPRCLADVSLRTAPMINLLVIPGGLGTRSEVHNPRLLAWLRWQSQRSELVMSVCTGSALLAKAGVLDGVQATTNKKAFAWVASQSDKVHWQKQARWVEDGKFWTSSGVSAGIDMSLAVMAKLIGEEAADHAACCAEYDRHRDPSWDPFSKLYGLVDH